MTQTSFDNYVKIIDFRVAKYAASTSIRLQIGARPVLLDYYWLSLLRKYAKLLHQYTLVAESISDEYPENFLKPSEMKQLSEWAHKVLGINYNIDFVLTISDVYQSIPSLSFSGTIKNVSTTNNTILQ